MRFAIEALVFTAIISLVDWLIGLRMNPVIYLFLMYVVTMRVRLLVDLGNILAKRKNFSAAESIYHFAGNLWPDATNHSILEVNKGTLRIQQGALDEAIQMIRNLLAHSEGGFLGIRYEAAAHYNLGIAYRRKGLEAQAENEFNTVLDIWPTSEYARAATIALRRTSNQTENKPPEA